MQKKNYINYKSLCHEFRNIWSPYCIYPLKELCFFLFFFFYKLNSIYSRLEIWGWQTSRCLVSIGQTMDMITPVLSTSGAPRLHRLTHSLLTAHPEIYIRVRGEGSPRWTCQPSKGVHLIYRVALSITVRKVNAKLECNGRTVQKPSLISQSSKCKFQ